MGSFFKCFIFIFLSRYELSCKDDMQILKGLSMKLCSSEQSHSIVVKHKQTNALFSPTIAVSEWKLWPPFLPYQSSHVPLKKSCQKNMLLPVRFITAESAGVQVFCPDRSCTRVYIKEWRRQHCQLAESATAMCWVDAAPQVPLGNEPEVHLVQPPQSLTLDRLYREPIS